MCAAVPERKKEGNLPASGPIQRSPASLNRCIHVRWVWGQVVLTAGKLGLLRERVVVRSVHMLLAPVQNG